MMIEIKSDSLASHLSFGQYTWRTMCGTAYDVLVNNGFMASMKVHGTNPWPFLEKLTRYLLLLIMLIVDSYQEVNSLMMRESLFMVLGRVETSYICMQ